MCWIILISWIIYSIYPSKSTNYIIHDQILCQLLLCKYWIHFTANWTLLSSDLGLLSLFDLSMFYFLWDRPLKRLFISIITTFLCSWFLVLLIPNFTPISVVYQSWQSYAWWSSSLPIRIFSNSFKSPLLYDIKCLDIKDYFHQWHPSQILHKM